MAVSEETMQMLGQDYSPAPVDLSWLNVDQTWGMKAKPGKRGLTLDEVNIGPYGPPGEESHEMTYRARGAVKREGVPHIGYFLDKKSDVWSENATLLYEEAVQRQWSSATDIPWEKLEPLPLPKSTTKPNIHWTSLRPRTWRNCSYSCHPSVSC